MEATEKHVYDVAGLATGELFQHECPLASESYEAARIDLWVR
jgi:hypothetical protein